jgi:hypothetical protein
MLKADKLRFANLASPDEAVRVAAATELQEKRSKYFEENPVEWPHNLDVEEGWVRAYRETKSEVARHWITRALVHSGLQSPDTAAVLVDALRPDHPFLPELFTHTAALSHLVPGGKERVLALHTHPNDRVRYLLASMLYGWQLGKRLDYASDAPVVRKLLTDSYSTARNYAAMAAKGWGKLEPEDRAALHRLLEISSTDNAAHYARELLAMYP